MQEMMGIKIKVKSILQKHHRLLMFVLQYFMIFFLFFNLKQWGNPSFLSRLWVIFLFSFILSFLDHENIFLFLSLFFVAHLAFSNFALSIGFFVVNFWFYLLYLRNFRQGLAFLIFLSCFLLRLPLLALWCCSMFFSYFAIPALLSAYFFVHLMENLTIFIQAKPSFSIETIIEDLLLIYELCIQQASRIFLITLGFFLIAVIITRSILYSNSKNKKWKALLVCTFFYILNIAFRALFTNTFLLFQILSLFISFIAIYLQLSFDDFLMYDLIETIEFEDEHHLYNLKIIPKITDEHQTTKTKTM